MLNPQNIHLTVTTWSVFPSAVTVLVFFTLFLCDVIKYDQVHSGHVLNSWISDGWALKSLIKMHFSTVFLFFSPTLSSDTLPKNWRAGSSVQPSGQQSDSGVSARRDRGAGSDRFMSGGRRSATSHICLSGLSSQDSVCRLVSFLTPWNDVCKFSHFGLCWNVYIWKNKTVWQFAKYKNKTWLSEVEFVECRKKKSF